MIVCLDLALPKRPFVVRQIGVWLVSSAWLAGERTQVQHVHCTSTRDAHRVVQRLAHREMLEQVAVAADSSFVGVWWLVVFECHRQKKW